MILLALAGGVLCGCFPSAEGQSDEQKNEYFIQGKERASARDYKGAIESFEKAAHINPRSALAHFELGVLYEQHSDQKENDYVTAMYHYLQAMKLRPNEYPSDNAQQRILACKQELIKTESLAPVAQSLIRDLERFKAENQHLQKQLDAAKAQLASRPPSPLPTVSNPGLLPPGASGLSSPTNRLGAGRSVGGRVTPLPSMTGARTYTVKQRDTPFSIAKQNGVKLEALMAANPNLNPKKLKVGQTLNIPAPAAAGNR